MLGRVAIWLEDVGKLPSRAGLATSAFEIVVRLPMASMPGLGPSKPRILLIDS